ncbi:MAG: hypothetical protein E1N59_1618 [Puniceicoccaceae bacterium 5H]|nr:MAG: hypothetical protein E1N59_1618 [Puniceicoccaceae bacterium 5H]
MSSKARQSKATSRPIDWILESKYLWIAARLLLALPLVDFAFMVQTAEVGGHPALPAVQCFQLAMALVLLGAAALLLFDRGIWLVFAAVGIGYACCLTLHLDLGQGLLPVDHSTLSRLAIGGGLLSAAVASRFHHLLQKW